MPIRSESAHRLYCPRLSPKYSQVCKYKKTTEVRPSVVFLYLKPIRINVRVSSMCGSIAMLLRRR